MTITEAKDKLQKARAGLVLSQPFFASMALRLTIKEDSDCETLWTDGKTLGYNPSYIDGLSLDECKGVLCHAVMHCACGHSFRRQERDTTRWNEACDYAINGLLDAADVTLPEGKYLDHSYDGKAAEEIYASLPEPLQNDSGQGSGTGSGNDNNDQQSQDPGKCGEVRDGKDEDGNIASQAELQQQEQEWKVALSQASQQAKAQGCMPGGMDRLVQDILEPLVNWREVLRRFVDQTAKSDYSWMRPNRRYIAAGLYLPSLKSEELGPIVVAIDTSGSIDRNLLDQFASEVTAILQDYRTTCKVIYCDSRVTGVEEFTQDDLPLKLNPRGGGGTDFRPVFDLVEETGELPACLIYLTDMYGSFPESEPSYPILWASVGCGIEAPFGETVQLKQ